MKKIKDAQKGMRGFVRGYWFNPVTNEIRHRFEHRNQLSYACSDALAQLMGGNGAYAPRYMGFIYGELETPTIVAPTSRSQTWTGLSEELADPGVVGNIQISPITLTPTITVDGTAGYSGNSVTYSAHTRSGGSGSYGFPLVSPYADALATGDYLYHAMLITRLTTSGLVYIPIARVTLAEDDAFLAKPDGFELALDWQISFF
jgi:hypothetical protein